MPRPGIVPILAFAVLLASSQSGSAAKPGKNPGALAFIASHGRGVVEVIDRPGAAPRELPAPPGSVQRVAWSRDGSRLAFTHAGTELLSDGVYVVDRSGRHERAMASLPVAGRSMTYLASPSWSPDGRAVVFTGNEPVSLYGVAQQSDLFVASSDGKGVRVLTALPGEEAYPAWSPDGSRVLFSYNPALCCGLALWSVPATGGTPQPFGPAGWTGIAPSWSASGDRVAFVGGPVTEPAALWVVRADGSRPVRIGDYDVPDFLTPPAWSPDGRWLAWPCSGLCTASSRGGHARMLGTSFAVVEAAWAPDSMTIAYSVARRSLWTIRRDGGQQRRVTSAWIEEVASPTWAPAR